MKINILTKNIKLTPALKDFIEEKINSLEKFAKILQNKEYFNHLPSGAKVEKKEPSLTFGKRKPRIEAWVEISKESGHHKKGSLFSAECQMRFPKKSIRSTAQSENLKLAINEVKDELQRELKEYKEKLVAEKERKSRILKKEIKISPQARFYRNGRIREEGL
jgi:ribosomal subunit interface protein